MFKKICSFALLSFVTISNFLVGEVKYDIQDIGTLQTHSSQAIAINNQGQILGWYNIDGSNNGKHFFVRNRDGSFQEVPQKENGSSWVIDWRYLTDEGSAYGVVDGNATCSILYTWDQYNGVIKLGNLPGKEIMTINNAGQVLIKSVAENVNGKLIKRPVIWQKGHITKLEGLVGNIGLESEESYGIDMNNNGEVVGYSVVYLNYKNTLYTQIHAAKWVDGQAIDLHNEVPKTPNSYATAINDYGDVLIDGHLIHLDGQHFNMQHGILKATDNNYFYKGRIILDRNSNKVADISSIDDIFHNDKESIWWGSEGILSLNDSCEIITNGVTVWGEKHAILLTPITSK